MNKKRDIGDEIKNLKSRKEFDSYWQIHQKLDKIHTCIEELKSNQGKSTDELKKYVPVALVATLESFIRSTIAKLINSNNEYLINAKDIFDGKFELDVYTKLHKREFTIGEFLAHQLPFGKFEHIPKHFDAILKENFMDKLLKFNINTFYIGYQGPHPKYFTPNYEQIVNDTKQVLKLRHIICHEMSVKLSIEEDELLRIYKSIRALIYQIYNYVYTILFPDSLLDNPELLQLSQAKYNEAIKQLDLVLDKIYKNPYTSFEAPLDVPLFKESQILWRQFIDKYAESLYRPFGNEIYQSLVLDELTDMIDDRREDLEIEFMSEKEF